MYISSRKINTFSEAMEINNFKASQGWLGKFLKRYGWNYLNLRGEADEMSYEEFNNIFQQWTENNLEKNQGIKGWER